MVLIQHLFGIPSLRQTYREIQVNVAYRWFLGYNLLEEIPHFATVSYAFCNRFPAELSEEIFAHILNKALNHRMLEPGTVFIDSTHIKASANKKKYQKAQVAKAAKVYEEQLRREVAEERKRLGKKDDDDQDGGAGSDGKTVTRTVSATDPDCGMFVKGSHERQFAYEAHTACDWHGWILGVEVTAGNINDSTAWDAIYGQVTGRFPTANEIVMDAGYKTPWIAKKTLEDGRIPLLPRTRYKGKKGVFRSGDFTYDKERDCFFCPQGQPLRHTTTSKDGKRTYRSKPDVCRSCRFRLPRESAAGGPIARSSAASGRSARPAVPQRSARALPEARAAPVVRAFLSSFSAAAGAVRKNVVFLLRQSALRTGRSGPFGSARHPFRVRPFARRRTCAGCGEVPRPRRRIRRTGGCLGFILIENYGGGKDRSGGARH